MSRSSIVKTVSRCMWARSLVITHRDHPLGCALGEQRLRDLLDHPGLRALADADEHRAVADGLHVAALERRHGRSRRRRTARRRRACGYQYSKSASGEHRVVAVDRRDVVGLAPARRPEHRVDRHAAVDPARRVPGEQRVRQRRQDERRSGRRARRPAGTTPASVGRGRGRPRRPSGRR